MNQKIWLESGIDLSWLELSQIDCQPYCVGSAAAVLADPPVITYVAEEFIFRNFIAAIGFGLLVWPMRRRRSQNKKWLRERALKKKQQLKKRWR